MKILKFPLFALFILFLSCKSENQKETERLFDELMTGHDEVMPKSMAIFSIRDKMIKAVEDATQDVKDKAATISEKLDKAEERMDVWMVEFGDAMNGEEDKKLELYKKLDAEIKQLKIDTEKAIREAKELTNEFSKE